MNVGEAMASWVAALGKIGDGCVAILALTLDWLGQLDSLALFFILTFFSLLLIAQASLLQRLWNAMVETQDAPDLVGLDRGLALPVVLFRLLTLPTRWPLYLWRFIRRRGSRRLFGQKKTHAKPAGSGEQQATPKPYLAATLGPSFALAGLGIAGLHVLAEASAYGIASYLGLDASTSSWQIMLLGGYPEWGAYVPLDDHPWLQALLAFALWAVLWTNLARGVRRTMRQSLGTNLIRQREQATTLGLWRRGFATRQLIRPSKAYRLWVMPLLLVAGLALTLNWFTLAAGSTRPTDFAVAWIVWLSWLIHWRLRGSMTGAATEGDESGAGVVAAGWQTVLDDLRERLQIVEPPTCDPPRAIEPLPPATQQGAGSPLLLELLGTGSALSDMQQRELERLTRLGHVHIDPVAPQGELSLGGEGGEGVREPDPELRHRLVLAPEGWGKTTLAFLAASNHALVHSLATLVIVRRKAEVQRLEETFGSHLRRSTLRWNIRLRRLGAPLLDDLAQGIVPELVICDLSSLRAELLARASRYRGFLERVGLVVLDDIESYYGPVEVHAQLAFRRLIRLLREPLHSAEKGEDGPAVLALGRDTMDRADRWVQNLCGLEASVRTYGYGLAESRVRQMAELARAGTPGEEGPDDEVVATSNDDLLSGHHQRFYRLGDFTTPSGEPLSLHELIGSCERWALPWHYRSCGDGRRHLGPESLDLLEPPDAHVPADQACVVILSGVWSEVRREVRQLRRAGSGFSRLRSRHAAMTDATAVGLDEPIALITVVDGDEDMAFTMRDATSDLKRWVDRLPRPFLRPPSAAARQAHLSADLVDRWSEVADLLDVYGAEIVPTLQRLATDHLLLAETRREVSATETFEDRLFVRTLVGDPRSGADVGPLATAQDDPVGPVSPSSPRRLAIVDRTTGWRLLEVDGEAAPLTHYPGRIFEVRAGRFIIVGSPSGEGEREAQAPMATTAEAPTVEPAHLLAEPILTSEISSPRRRLHLRLLGEGGREEGARAGEEPRHFYFGRHAVVLQLADAEVAIEHRAALRIDAESGEVRQVTAGQTGGDALMPSLRTEVLRLVPNPRGHGDDAPALDLQGARLIAAAMGRVLPSLFRGGGEALGLGLAVGPERPDSNRVLEGEDCFVFFDLGSGGTGAARALRRDGVELLLRLTRLVLERVLSHRRLMAMGDEWADTQSSWIADEIQQDPLQTAQRELAVRRAALTWLDSRLRPEGGPRVLDLGTDRAWDSEPGEGDVFDIGRCWYGERGSTANLLWVKHRWRLAGGGEAALDIGFERAAAETSRLFTEHDEMIGTYKELYERQRHVQASLDDGLPWGAPRGAWWLDDRDKPNQGRLSSDDPAHAYHVLAAAVAAHSRPLLEPLARKLRQEGPGDDRLALATWLSRFVQGIPFSLPLALRQGLRPPVSTLLFRRGDCDSKSLLLAILLEHCGIDAGLFVSFAQAHAVVGAAVPQDFEGLPEAAEPRAEEIAQRLRDWSAAAALPDLPQIWAELAKPEATEGPAHQVYIPIESTVYSPVGASALAQRESWSFLPLSPFRLRVDPQERIMASDRAEEEAPQ